MKDEAKIEDVFFASYILYNGLPVMKCTNYPGASPVWFFSVPSCDLELMKQEFDTDQSILVKSFVQSFKEVQRYSALARQHGGEFLTRELKEALGIARR